MSGDRNTVNPRCQSWHDAASIKACCYYLFTDKQQLNNQILHSNAVKYEYFAIKIT